MMTVYTNQARASNIRSSGTRRKRAFSDSFTATTSLAVACTSVHRSPDRYLSDIHYYITCTSSRLNSAAARAGALSLHSVITKLAVFRPCDYRDRRTRGRPDVALAVDVYPGGSVGPRARLRAHEIADKNKEKISSLSARNA